MCKHRERVLRCSFAELFGTVRYGSLGGFWRPARGGAMRRYAAPTFYDFFLAAGKSRTIGALLWNPASKNAVRRKNELFMNTIQSSLDQPFRLCLENCLEKWPSEAVDGRT